MIRVPAIINNVRYLSIQRRMLAALDGAILGEMCQVPFIKTHELAQLEQEKFTLLQSMPAARVLQAMQHAARLLRADNWEFASFSKEKYRSLVTASTGLPHSAMEEEIMEMADMLGSMEQIVAVQLPASIESALDKHEFTVPGNRVGYYPAGKSLLVKLPGNIPTICVYWLMPLALKRPLILIPPPEDPFTHLVLLEALQQADPELASCVQYVPADDDTWPKLIDNAEQALLPESAKEIATRPAARLAKTSFIHYGRTKLLIPGKWTDATVQLAFRRMTWKYGRTCTGLTSVIVAQDAAGFCEALSRSLHEKFTGSFDDNKDRLPRFGASHAARINELVDDLVAKGEAADITAQHRGVTRLLPCNGQAMLLPSVLLVKQHGSLAFGLELPFPFITVAEADTEAAMISLSKNSLILSVVTQDRALLEKLCAESSIRKVFAGAHVERGYHYMDPHEGYMADFLYHKKAVAW